MWEFITGEKYSIILKQVFKHCTWKYRIVSSRSWQGPVWGSCNMTGPIVGLL